MVTAGVRRDSFTSTTAPLSSVVLDGARPLVPAAEDERRTESDRIEPADGAVRDGEHTAGHVGDRIDADRCDPRTRVDERVEGADRLEVAVLMRDVGDAV